VLRLALPVLVTAFATAVAAVPPLGVGCGSSAPTSAARAMCGVERWTVKTLQDRPRLLPRAVFAVRRARAVCGGLGFPSSPSRLGARAVATIDEGRAAISRVSRVGYPREAFA
jgi:hypothetical protein